MSICDFVGVAFQPGMLDVNLQGPSNSSSARPEQKEAVTGIQTSVKDKGKDSLSTGEITIIQLLTKRNMKACGFQNVSVNFPLTIIPLLIYFPVHLLATLILNIERSGNPLTYILKRFK